MNTIIIIPLTYPTDYRIDGNTNTPTPKEIQHNIYTAAINDPDGNIFTSF